VSPAIYNVMRRDGRWKMVVDQIEFGQFATEDQAVRIAIETAHAAGRANMWGAHVILHETDRMSRIIWTYGRDPFPPSRFG
jgi:hypothetical protein